MTPDAAAPRPLGELLDTLEWVQSRYEMASSAEESREIDQDRSEARAAIVAHVAAEREAARREGVEKAARWIESAAGTWVRDSDGKRSEPEEVAERMRRALLDRPAAPEVKP